MEINTKGQELRLPKEYLTEANDSIHEEETNKTKKKNQRENIFKS